MNEKNSYKVFIKYTENKQENKLPVLAASYIFKTLAHYRSKQYFEDKNSVSPPKLAEYIIYLFIPRNSRDAILGDLEEDFNEVSKKFGLWHARLHYWVQVLRCIWPLIHSLGGKLIMLSIQKLKATM